jgi:membrane-bound metal-dependent hydrolase YbcI (DUF457 family)
LLLRGFTPRFSFGVFATVQVLIDIETVANLMSDSLRLHTAAHTFIGSLVPATIAIIIHRPVFRIGKRFLSPLPTLGRWAADEVSFSRIPITLSALVGAWSHVVLDGVMHADAQPFAPFSAGNPLLLLVSSSTENLICLACGFAGLLLLGIRIAKK